MEVLAVRSSRHNEQFLRARSASEIDENWRAVCSSCSAGTGGADSSGKFARIVVTGMWSIEHDDRSLLVELGTFSNVEEASAAFDVRGFEDRRREVNRCNNLKPIRTPNSEYDGGRTLGFSGMDDI